MMMSAFSFSSNSPPDVISSSMYIEKALAERVMSSLTRTGGTVRCISFRSLLELHHIEMAFGAQDVLTDVSFKVQKGEKVGLIGENGCGKSTILKIIAGIEIPISGPVNKTSGTSVGYLAQQK